MHKYNKILPIGTVIDRPTYPMPAYIVKSYGIESGFYYLLAMTSTDIRTIYRGKKMNVQVVEQDSRPYVNSYFLHEDLLDRMLKNKKVIVVPPEKAELYLSRHPHFVPQKFKNFIATCQTLYFDWEMPRDRFIKKAQKIGRRMLINEKIPVVIPDLTHDKEQPPLENLQFGL